VNFEKEAENISNRKRNAGFSLLVEERLKKVYWKGRRDSVRNTILIVLGLYGIYLLYGIINV